MKLNNEELLDFLRACLGKATEIKSSFTVGLSKADKQVIAKNFQSEVLSILDYAYTNFPSDIKKLGGYFPRPMLGESKKQYLSRIKILRKGNQQIHRPKRIIEFLKSFYRINGKHGFAISYVRGKVKHEVPNQFNEEIISKLKKADIISDHPNPLKMHPDGSIEIPGVGSFAQGSNVKIKSCSFINGEHVTIVNDLEFNEEKIIGDEIIFSETERLKFIDWANNCVSVCAKTIDLFSRNLK